MINRIIKAWVVQVGGYIGQSKIENIAAEMANNAAKELFGDFAILNII